MVGVLRVFQQADIQYALAGELAEVLHGSPLLPVTGVVTIVPRVGQREPLSAAAATAGGKPIASPATSAIDAPARFALEAHGAELVIEPAPAATQGYHDLRRNAAAIQLAGGSQGDGRVARRPRAHCRGLRGPGTCPRTAPYAP